MVISLVLLLLLQLGQQRLLGLSLVELSQYLPILSAKVSVGKLKISINPVHCKNYLQI
jgi:hypothetical protein